MEMAVKIYTLEHPETGNIRYVGKTIKKLSYRLAAHCNVYGTTHKDNWIKKLKRNNLKPKIKLLEEVSEEDWIFYERFWIEQIRCWGYDLTNHTVGGEGQSGHKQSEESNIKRSKSLTGRKRPQWVRDKISKSHLGKPTPDEVKKKISKTLSGKKRDPKHYKNQRKPVAKIDKKTDEIICTYDSITKAAKDVNGHTGAISNVCNNNQNTSAGYKWKFLKI